VSWLSRKFEADLQLKAVVWLAVRAHCISWINHTRVAAETGHDTDDWSRPKHDDRCSTVRTNNQVWVSVGVDVEARRVAERVAEVGEADGT